MPDEDVEIHAKDMINHQGVFRSSSPASIQAILTDVFDFIADPQTDLTIIAVLIDKSRLRRDKDIETWRHIDYYLRESIDSLTDKTNRDWRKNFRMNTE